MGSGKKYKNVFAGEILYLTLHPHFKAHGLKTARKGALRKALGEYQSGQMGQTVNLLVYTFGGSNPSSPTQKIAGISLQGE